MIQEYARVSEEMPENEDKKFLRQELTYEIENNDIKDEYVVPPSRTDIRDREQRHQGRIRGKILIKLQ